MLFGQSFRLEYGRCHGFFSSHGISLFVFLFVLPGIGSGVQFFRTTVLRTLCAGGRHGHI